MSFSFDEVDNAFIQQHHQPITATTNLVVNTIHQHPSACDTPTSGSDADFNPPNYNPFTHQQRKNQQHHHHQQQLATNRNHSLTTNQQQQDQYTHNQQHDTHNNTTDNLTGMFYNVFNALSPSRQYKHLKKDVEKKKQQFCFSPKPNQNQQQQNLSYKDNMNTQRLPSSQIAHAVQQPPTSHSIFNPILLSPNGRKQQHPSTSTIMPTATTSNIDLTPTTTTIRKNIPQQHQQHNMNNNNNNNNSITSGHPEPPTATSSSDEERYEDTIHKNLMYAQHGGSLLTSSGSPQHHAYHNNKNNMNNTLHPPHNQQYPNFGLPKNNTSHQYYNFLNDDDENNQTQDENQNSTDIIFVTHGDLDDDDDDDDKDTSCLSNFKCNCLLIQLMREYGFIVFKLYIGFCMLTYVIIGILLWVTGAHHLLSTLLIKLPYLGAKLETQIKDNPEYIFFFVLYCVNSLAEPVRIAGTIYTLRTYYTTELVIGQQLHQQQQQQHNCHDELGKTGINDSLFDYQQQQILSSSSTRFDNNNNNDLSSTSTAMLTATAAISSGNHIQHEYEVNNNKTTSISNNHSHNNNMVVNKKNDNNKEFTLYDNLNRNNNDKPANFNYSPLKTIPPQQQPSIIGKQNGNNKQKYNQRSFESDIDLDDTDLGI